MAYILILIVSTRQKNMHLGYRILELVSINFLISIVLEPF